MVHVGFDPNFQQKKVPAFGNDLLPALVDTGAIMSFIDNDLALKLALPVVDRQKISGSNGEHEVDTYLAQIHVPDLNFTVTGAFGGVGLHAGGQRHQVLMGRTFLQHFKMVYDGMTGDVELIGR